MADMDDTYLPAVVDALFDSIVIRMASAASEYGHRGITDWKGYRNVLNLMVRAYGVYYMVYQDSELGDHEHLETIKFSEETWELLNQMLTAEAWAEVPTHELQLDWENCPVCINIINGFHGYVFGLGLGPTELA